MEMEEEGVGLVLARASELRLKISNCIEKATAISSNPSDSREQGKGEGFVDGTKNPKDGDDEEEVGEEDEDEEEEEEEAERLLRIRDALESLEAQLASLQNLRQQQQYERQVALAEIDYSRKMLLEKLKEYHGNDLEVIHEASAFACEKVEYENHLLLPPYASRSPQSLVSDNGYLSNLTSTHKSIQNGAIPNGPDIKRKKKPDNSNRNPVQAGSGNSKKGIAYFISSVIKTMLPVVGVISMLSLFGLGHDVRRKRYPVKILSLFDPTGASKQKRSGIQCPPGKILVMENGEARCLVKERVEIPFDSFNAKQDINFGCG